MIYLAQPYSHDNPDVREWRYEIALHVATLLFKVNKPVFSPIIHWHIAAKVYNLGKDSNTWWYFNRTMLNHSSKLYLLDIDGWKTSRGVYQELVHAEKLGLPVYSCNIIQARDTQLDIILTTPKVLMRESVYHEDKDNPNTGADSGNPETNDAG